MPYKIDLHCYSFFLRENVSSPEDMIAPARRKGLDGFALTDHISKNTALRKNWNNTLRPRRGRWHLAPAKVGSA